ncbi:MAG: Putative membrane protein [Candidatus Tokpelaia hoelldobleri]|uniref:Membrane protein n=1 Tax=Candidatus Tokpelaia hoelldobleri TaxID=1902579 RepID=A0A1U9JUP8_9HYPH|nr:MAG: Putative membrane protein [Candidatus Tokpelaia hoelldoblerii]
MHSCKDKTASPVRGSLVAAIFLMATSAIGPGFITQTATFTVQLGASFAFAILASVLIDFVLQLNIWRIIVLTRKRASDIANEALPGSGYFLAVLIIAGGLVFNIGNIAGGGAGLDAMFGTGSQWGGIITAVTAVLLFTSGKAGLAMDRVIVLLGIVMIIMTCYVAFVSGPPVGKALRQTVWPETLNFATITTIVGGTIGGYITYAGAHRLLDAGITGEKNLRHITRAAMSGIIVTGIMRYVLFLAILGVAAAGATIVFARDAANPAAQAFEYAAGSFGLRLFGLILWAASITSVIGAAYTSVSFMTVFKKNMTGGQRNIATMLFILISLAVFAFLKTAPTALLVFAGGFNGLILPVGFSIFLYVGFMRPDMMGGHRYNRPLLYLGTVACLFAWYMGIVSIKPVFAFLSL